MKHKIVSIDNEVCCPECGFHYNHISGFRYDPHGGYRGEEEDRAKVEIDMEGECGHCWTMALYEWKGIVLLEGELNQKKNHWMKG